MRRLLWLPLQPGRSKKGLWQVDRITSLLTTLQIKREAGKEAQALLPEEQNHALLVLQSLESCCLSCSPPLFLVVLHLPAPAPQRHHFMPQPSVPMFLVQPPTPWWNRHRKRHGRLSSGCKAPRTPSVGAGNRGSLLQPRWSTAKLGLRSGTAFLCPREIISPALIHRFAAG